MALLCQIVTATLTLPEKSFIAKLGKINFEVPACAHISCQVFALTLWMFLLLFNLLVVIKARIHALCQATGKLSVQLPASSMGQPPVGCIIGNCKVTGKIVTVAQLMEELSELQQQPAAESEPPALHVISRYIKAMASPLSFRSLYGMTITCPNPSIQESFDF